MALTKISTKVIANSAITADKINISIYENPNTIDFDHTIAANINAHSAGPLAVSGNITVLGNWVII